MLAAANQTQPFCNGLDRLERESITNVADDDQLIQTLT
jgi:hypothetical protein